MPSIHRERYVNRTNKKGTCLYCGRKLGKEPGSSYWGYSDQWCTLTCAYWFADAMVMNGHRLIKFKGDPSGENELEVKDD